MGNIFKTYIIMGALLLAVGCKSIKTSKSGSGTGYYENLATWRPDVTLPTTPVDTVTNTGGETPGSQTSNPTLATIKPVTYRLNAKLDSISSQSQSERYIDGFTIQVYSGRNREAALIAKGKAGSMLPDMQPYQIYRVPNFKVNVGRFYSKVEAQKTFQKLKPRFPTAIVVMQKIKIEDR